MDPRVHGTVSPVDTPRQAGLMDTSIITTITVLYGQISVFTALRCTVNTALNVNLSLTHIDMLYDKSKLYRYVK